MMFIIGFHKVDDVDRIQSVDNVQYMNIKQLLMSDQMLMLIMLRRLWMFLMAKTTVDVW
jgi:hypothetical protein